MSYLLKRLFRRGAKPDLPKTREFDIDLEVQFTDKIGRIVPNVKVTRSNKNNSQEEKFVFSLTDDLVTAPEAALENAFTSPGNLHAVATAFNIWTFCDIPNYVKESDWCPYTYFERAYRNILSRQPDRGDDQIRVPQAPGAISVFDAEMRYLEFQYLRFIHNAGLFDSPNVNLYPEDVDRLVSCGWLTDEDFDFDLGRLMLARGACNRVARQTGQLAPGINGTKNSPLPWSFNKTIPKPDARAILEYVSYLEGWRSETENETGKAPETFEMLLFGRGQIHPIWIETRRRETGLFGLKNFGISDKRALELIRTVDASYVLPDEYSREKVYDRIAPHKPSPSEQLDPRLDEKLPEPRQDLVVPDIYVTDPPYGDMEVDVAPIPLFVYRKSCPLPRGYELVKDRKIARLPPRHCHFLSKPNPRPKDKHPRPIITPGLRRRDTTLLGWDNKTLTHKFIKRVDDYELKRGVPAEFEIPAGKRPCPMPTNGRALRRHDTTLIGFNTKTKQPIVVGGRAGRSRRNAFAPWKTEQAEVEAMVFDLNPHLRVPLKKFKRRQRDLTPAEDDYERPMKKARNDIDHSIPQPEPTPMGAEPTRHPLLVGGVYTSYEPEDVKQQREERFRQREAADPLFYLNPRNRAGQMQPWFSDLDAKIEFIEIGPGLILMESTGRLFEYSRAECLYRELMPLPEPIPEPTPAPSLRTSQTQSRPPPFRCSKSDM